MRRGVRGAEPDTEHYSFPRRARLFPVCQLLQHARIAKVLLQSCQHSNSFGNYASVLFSSGWVCSGGAAQSRGIVRKLSDGCNGHQARHAFNRGLNEGSSKFGSGPRCCWVARRRGLISRIVRTFVSLLQLVALLTTGHTAVSHWLPRGALLWKWLAVAGVGRVIMDRGNNHIGQ